MIRDNQNFLNRIHMVMDGAVTAASYVIAYEIRFETPLDDPMIPHLPMYMYMEALPFLIVGYLFLYYEFNLYNSKRASGRKREFYNIIKANTVGMIMTPARKATTVSKISI